MKMHCASLFVLLAGAASAQSTVPILNLSPEPTLTSVGSDAKGTTYEHLCPSSASGTGFSTAVAPSTPTATGPGIATATPTTAAQARRQNSGQNGGVCEPYTIIQGASTWEYHLTYDTPGAKTVDANCTWSGEVSVATLTCSMDQRGSGAVAVTTAGMLNRTDASSIFGPYVATVVTPTAGSSSGAAATDVGVSSTQSVQSTGAGAAAPLATGAVALVGGLFAAALAL